MEFLTFMGVLMQSKAAVCLCASSLPKLIIDRLSKKFHVITLPADSTVAKPVQCHPDMICAVMDGHIYFHESYANAYPSVIEEIEMASGLTAIITHENRHADYPYDISLNAAVLPSALVCSLPHTAAELIDAAEKSGRKIISVKQGYTACSSLICCSSVLTSDIGICRNLKNNGIDCTHISSEGIILPGYNCGFIGGSGGIFGKMLYLFGSTDNLKDRDILCEYVTKNDLTVVSLTDGPLTDYGGIKFI